MRRIGKVMLIVILLSLVDTVTPFPILGVILIYVILRRPRWFKDLTAAVYSRP